MNYYQARQKKNQDGTAGGWHFTCMRDRRVWPVGPCADHEPHETAEAAEACYANYLLDNLKVSTLANTQERCQECGEWTQGIVEAAPHGAMVVLCEKHQSREIYAKHWSPPTAITSSY